MTEFSEDKIFKNISDTDVRILLDILGVETKNIHNWTKELRLLDPGDYIPDIILELDDENLIIELQSTPVDDNFSARGLTYVAVANRRKENEKEMNLMVLSTAEDSKTIEYYFNKNSVFIYLVVSLKDLNGEEIIKTTEEKIKRNESMESEELILYSLIPLIKSDEIEKYIKRVVENLIQVENATESIKNLTYGIEWLIVDKFIENEEIRQTLCDRLGERMSLIYEYGERRENDGRKEGIKEIITSLIESGETLQEISQKTKKSIPELEKILKD